MALPYNLNPIIIPPDGWTVDDGHPLGVGLVGMWLPYQPNPPDLSGNGNNGTTNGNQVLVQGPAGPMQNFGATGQYINIGAPASLELPYYVTIAAHIVQPVSSSGTRQFVVAKDFNAGQRQYSLGTSNNQLYLEVNGSAIVSGTGPTFGGTSALTHIAATGFDNGTNETWVTYVNGASINSTTAAFIAANPSASWQIAQRGYPGFADPFTGYIQDVHIYNYPLPAALMQWLAREPFAMLRPPTQRTYFVASTGGTNVNVTGAAATTSAGSVVPSISFPLTGASVTTAAGAVTVTTGTTVSVTGAAVTTAAGSVVPSVGVSILGAAATTAAGTVRPSPSLTVSGAVATTSAGAVTPSIGASIIGASAVTAAGAVSFGSVTNVPVTGAAATSAAGTVLPSVGVQLAGAGVTTAAGAVSFSGVTNVPVTGARVSTAAGGATAAVSLAISGASATTQAGTVGPSIFARAIGASAITAAGTVTAGSNATNVSITGAAARTAAGIVTISGTTPSFTPDPRRTGNIRPVSRFNFVRPIGRFGIVR